MPNAWRFKGALMRRSGKANGQLDPLSLIITTDHGAILYYSRQYERAIEQFRAVLGMEPAFPRVHIVLFAEVEKGLFAEALADAAGWRHSDDSPVWEVQAYIYSRWGQQEQSRRALAQWEQRNKGRKMTPTVALTMAYIAMGNREEAFVCLEKAYEDHSNALTSLKVEPAL